jgi:tetratricopeptide (TPR) repeat protein
VAAVEPLPLSQQYWKDEAFLKSFNGSYRINARIEPSVGSEERALLVSIQKLMADGKREDALKKLQASPLVKTSAAVAFNEGNLLFELGQLKKSAESYQRAIRQFPNFRRAHRNLGFVFARENDWENAMPELEESIRLGDMDAATLGQLAYGRLQKEQYASALQAYRLAQLTQPESIDWKAGVAQCLQYLQRNEEALALMDEVIKARPEEASYYLLQASILLSMDKNDGAIVNLELVRRLRSGNESKLDAENHLLLAILHLRSGSVKLARPLMLSALAMSPKPPVVAALNALEFTTQLRNWKLAKDFAKAMETAYPEAEIKDVQLFQKRQRLGALIDIDSGDNPERGAKVLGDLIQKDPLDGASLILLARYRSSEKRLQEAEMLLQQAIRIEGFAYEAQVDLAKLYVSSARYRDAISLLDKALQLTPSDALKAYREAVLKLAEASE